MSEKKTYSLFKILSAILWITIGSGTIVLLVAAMNKKNSMRCQTVEVNIDGIQNNYFIDKDEVKNMVEKLNNGKLEGIPVSNFNLEMMEASLRKNLWIRDAELFFDNNEHLKIEIAEREPVARIFTDKGNSFYVDTAMHVLPVSDKSSARIPVFTNFIETSTLSKADSALIRDIAFLGNYIMKDPFWMAQIDQVDIQPGHTFEMIPKIGNQVIVFGDVSNHEMKFSKLLMFYKNVLAKSGWNKYSRINVQYKGQIVAIKRDATDIASDSLRTIQIMQAIVANTQARVNDSLSNIQLAAEDQQDLSGVAPAERDEVDEVQVTDETPIIKAPEKSSVITTPKPVLVENKPLQKVQQPVKKVAVKPAIIIPKAANKNMAVKSATTKTVATKESTIKKVETKKPVLKVEAGKIPAIKKTAVKKKEIKSVPKAVMPAKNDY